MYESTMLGLIVAWLLASTAWRIIQIVSWVVAEYQNQRESRWGVRHRR